MSDAVGRGGHRRRINGGRDAALDRLGARRIGAGHNSFPKQIHRPKLNRTTFIYREPTTHFFRPEFGVAGRRRAEEQRRRFGRAGRRRPHRRRRRWERLGRRHVVQERLFDLRKTTKRKKTKQAR